MDRKSLKVSLVVLCALPLLCGGARSQHANSGWKRLNDRELQQFVGKTNCCRGTEHHADCLGPNQQPHGCYGCAEFPHSVTPDDPCPNVIGDEYTQITHTKAHLDPTGWGVSQSRPKEVCYETRLCDPQSTLEFHRCPGVHGGDCVEDPTGTYDCRICAADSTVLVTHYVYPSVCQGNCGGGIGSSGGGGGNNDPS